MTKAGELDGSRTRWPRGTGTDGSRAFGLFPDPARAPQQDLVVQRPRPSSRRTRHRPTLRLRPMLRATWRSDALAPLTGGRPALRALHDALPIHVEQAGKVIQEARGLQAELASQPVNG